MNPNLEYIKLHNGSYIILDLSRPHPNQSDTYVVHSVVTTEADAIQLGARKSN